MRPTIDDHGPAPLPDPLGDLTGLLEGQSPESEDQPSHEYAEERMTFLSSARVNSDESLQLDQATPSAARYQRLADTMIEKLTSSSSVSFIL